MATNLTAVNTYGPDTLGPIPVNGETVDLTLFNGNALQPLLNKTYFLKLIQDGILLDLGRAETKIGLSFQNDDVINWTSNNHLVDGSTLKAGCEALDAVIGLNSVKATQLSTKTGLSLDDDPTDYANNHFISNGESHNVSIGKLDLNLNTVNTSLASNVSDTGDNTSSITNIIAKVGVGAGDAPNFTFDSTYFITNGDTLKEVAEKLDKPLYAARRGLSGLFERNVENWADFSSIGAGGVTGYFYDDLFNADKQHANSTSNAYDNIDQSFGRDDISWVYLSTHTFSGNVDRFKIKSVTSGSVTIKINFIGDLENNFVTVGSQDTIVNVPEGTNAVLRIEGAAGAKLYNYMAYALKS